MPDIISPNDGQLVITSDGVELGRVKETTVSAFKVDAPFAPDFWLDNSTVEVEEGGILRLNLAKSAIGYAKQHHSTEASQPDAKGKLAGGLASD